MGNRILIGCKQHDRTLLLKIVMAVRGEHRSAARGVFMPDPQKHSSEDARKREFFTSGGGNFESFGAPAQ